MRDVALVAFSRSNRPGLQMLGTLRTSYLELFGLKIIFLAGI
jgi:hypothetical protein